MFWPPSAEWLRSAFERPTRRSYFSLPPSVDRVYWDSVIVSQATQSHRVQHGHILICGDELIARISRIREHLRKSRWRNGLASR
jgi:hypothetical protein